MEVRSIYKYARISPLKARDVAREIQGLPVSQALDILTFTPRKAAQLINKTLQSAVANAENNHELSVDTLVVKEATIGKGPTFKRFKPRARGSASGIKKPTSHIRIILSDEIEIPEPKRRSGGKKKRKPAAAKAAPAKPAAAPAEPAEETPAPEPAAAAEVAPVESPGVTRDDETLGLVYDEAPSSPDDLKEITGVGPVMEGKLNENGVYTYRQIASWTEANAAAFGELISLNIDHETWVAQAKALHQETHGEEA